MLLHEQIIEAKQNEDRNKARLAGYDVPDDEIATRLPPVEVDDDERDAWQRALQMNATNRRN